MNIGIIGLGLIGGSLAKAFKANTDDIIYGFDRPEVMAQALESRAIDFEFTIPDCGKCDLIILCLYPAGTLDFIRAHCSLFGKDAIITDSCGVKGKICAEAEKIAEAHGFTFIGGHPMAGTENAGFQYSDKDLFKNASMILASYAFNEKAELLKDIYLKLGFSRVIMTDPDAHDNIIGYTSQLAHVLSSAYIKIPTALKHAGFSAGSYKDMTRVAKLNEDMWTELFLDNKENLSGHIEELIRHLNDYNTAIKSGDAEALKALLKKGRELKDYIDGGNR